MFKTQVQKKIRKLYSLAHFMININTLEFLFKESDLPKKIGTYFWNTMYTNRSPTFWNLFSGVCKSLSLFIRILMCYFELRHSFVFSVFSLILDEMGKAWFTGHDSLIPRNKLDFQF